MDNKQETELKAKLNSLAKRGLYMGAKECPAVVTGIEVEATDDLYDEAEDLWYEDEFSDDDYEPDYDRLTKGIVAYISVIYKDDDNTYGNDCFSVGYPLEDPMQVIANTKVRKKVVKHMINDCPDYNYYEFTEKPMHCSKKFKFWLRHELTKKLKHLK